MHADIEQLLSIRDGEPVDAAVHRHVVACRSCRDELARLEDLRRRLRELPVETPRQSLWEGVATQVMAPAPRSFPWASAAAVAATCVLAVGLVTRNPAPETAASRPAIAPSAEFAEIVPTTPPAPAGVDYTAESRRLEATLRAMPAAPRVTRASTADTISVLEDRIAMIDLNLSQPGLSPRARQTLWKQRVRLMQVLVRVRYAQVRDTL